MPRKKSETTNSAVDETAESPAESNVTSEFSRRSSRSKTTQKEDATTQTDSMDSLNGKPVGKLDSLDFYRTQLKLEGLESQIAKTNQEATTIGQEIMKVVKVGKEGRKNQKIQGNLEGEDPHDAPIPAKAFEETQDKIEELYKRLEDTQAEKDALNHEISKLRDDLARKYHDNRQVDKGLGESYGIIVRISESTFASNLFHDGNYDVRLAKDGSYIKFRPDVEGRAVCRDGAISIPMLPRYLPYKGTREFGAIPIDGNTVMIRL